MRILASSGEPSRMASKNPPVLMQAVVLDPRGALPAQLEGAFERGANEAAERGEKVISGRLEDPHVEVEIRADQIAGAVLELLHAADRRRRSGRSWRVSAPVAASAAASGSTICRSTNSSATKFSVGVDLQMPGEHLRIEHVPVGLGPHASADLRPRDNHRLGGQHAIGFPQRGAGHRKARAHVDRVGQQRSGRIDPADDLAAEPARRARCGYCARTVWAARSRR